MGVRTGATGRRSASVAGVTLLLGLTVAASPALAGPPTGSIRHAGGADAISGSYLVVLNSSLGGQVAPVPTELAAPEAVAALAVRAGELTDRYGGRVVQVYGAAVPGFEATMSERTARRLAADPRVSYVEQNRWLPAPETIPEVVPADGFSTTGTQTGAPWNLAFLDGVHDTVYQYPNTAPTVRAYVIDSGIKRLPEFGIRVAPGYNSVDSTPAADDCTGRGTFSASVIGGNHFGVAKNVQLVPVRVSVCGVSGTLGDLVEGINWVTANAVKPAVANLGLVGTVSSILEHAVTTSITSGVGYSVAAGDSGVNACNYSPSRVPDAVTLGAVSNTLARPSWSNYGVCLDLFSFGASVTASWHTGATMTSSGTWIATAHATGVAAMVLEQNPTWTPQQVRDHLVNTSRLHLVTNPGTGTPNRLLTVVS